MKPAPSLVQQQLRRFEGSYRGWVFPSVREGQRFIGAALRSGFLEVMNVRRLSSGPLATLSGDGRGHTSRSLSYLTIHKLRLLSCRQFQAPQNTADRIEQNDIGLGPVNSLWIKSDQAAGDFHRFKSPPRGPVAHLAAPAVAG